MTAFDQAWGVVKSPWREQWVDKEGLQTHTIPAGTILYHGTPSKYWADDPEAELDVPAFFSDYRDVAHYFGSKWHQSEEEPNIHEYEVLEDIILPRFADSDYENEWGESFDDIRDRLFGGVSSREWAEAVASKGYPGWAVPDNYDSTDFGPGGDYLLTALDKLRRIR